MLEELVDFIFIYVLVWWVVLFMVLPIGIQPEDSPEVGHQAGAPKNPDMKKKLKMTSILAFIVSLAISLGLYVKDAYADEVAEIPTVNPALCQQLVTYQKPDGVDYEAGVDVHGNDVVSADLNPSPKIEPPEVVEFDLTIDLAEHLDLDHPKGLEGQAKLGTITVHQNGDVFYNGEPLNRDSETVLREMCEEKN